MKLVFERPPVTSKGHEVRDSVAGNGTAVDRTERMIEDTFNLIWIRHEVVEYLWVRDERDDGWVLAHRGRPRSCLWCARKSRWWDDGGLTRHDDVVLPHSPDGHYRHDGLEDSDIVHILTAWRKPNLLVCFSALAVS